MESAHGDGQDKLNQQIQKLQGENVSLGDENDKVIRKMEEFWCQLQHS